MVGHHIWTLIHHQNSMFDIFLHVVQRSVYRQFIRVGGFLNNVPESTKGSIVSLIFTWIFSSTLPWVISSWLADPRLSFRIDMGKSSSFFTWSTLLGTEFSFSMLECSSLSGRYISKRNHWFWYLIFVPFGTTLNVKFLVHCQINRCLMLYW